LDKVARDIRNLFERGPEFSDFRFEFEYARRSDDMRASWGKLRQWIAGLTDRVRLGDTVIRRIDARKEFIDRASENLRDAD